MSQPPEDLGQKIKAAREKHGLETTPQDDRAKQSGSSSAAAMRVATDLVAALVVGTFLGYWLDEWLGTRPLFMIAMFFIGFAAGFLNIYRSQTGQTFRIGTGSIRKEPNNDKNDQTGN